MIFIFAYTYVSCIVMYDAIRIYAIHIIYVIAI